MIDHTLIMAVIAGIGLLLFLILYLKIQAFPALLMASIAVGLLAGLPPAKIIDSIQNGIAGTLGFIAVIVGLGALFGAILEHSGGVQSLSAAILHRTGERKASWAMMLTGFIVSIPVFFDVGFIILAPVVYALQKNTSKSLLLYGLPLLAGLAVTHAFIPPTPGPVAVAEMLGADLGLVMIAGALAGLPAAIVAGPLFGAFISKRIFIEAPEFSKSTDEPHRLPSASMVAALVLLPIFLILMNNIINSPLLPDTAWLNTVRQWTPLAGHPFMALLIANIMAWYFLGVRLGFTRSNLLEVSTRSLAPAGLIILITGAGGVFKQILTDTGAGKMMAAALMQYNFSAIVFAFIAAATIRIIQGSATVAMITSAGMTAAFLDAGIYTDFQKALLVISIAAGASIFSHVNDSGFWLVSRYFGMTEKQTLQTWSVSSTLIAITGFAMTLLLYFFTK